MASEDIEAVEGLFAGWRRLLPESGWQPGQPIAERDRAALVAEILGRFEGALDPGVEYQEDPAWPGADTHRGRDAVLARFREYFESMNMAAPVLERVTEGRTGIVAVYLLTGTGVESNTPFEQRIAWPLEVRSGLIRRLAAYFDPAEALRAAGAPDREAA